jgi:dsDNA-specific endonuclease/ATPase MutS2
VTADEVIEVPITDTLDLHTFAPGEVKELVTDYLALAQERGFAQVRVIHGKGIGNLRRLVHAVLDRHPAVAAYALAGDGGGWGATIVQLRPRGA